MDLGLWQSGGRKRKLIRRRLPKLEWAREVHSVSLAFSHGQRVRPGIGYSSSVSLLPLGKSFMSFCALS